MRRLNTALRTLRTPFVLAAQVLSLPKRQPPRPHPERPRQPLNRVRRRDVPALLDIVHRRVRQSGPASQRQHAETRGLPRLKETLSDSEAGERFFSHSVAVAWSG